MFRGTLFIGLFMVLTHTLMAQSSNNNNTSDARPKADALWNLDAIVSAELPGADMAKRFGYCFRIGPGVRYKTNTNWILGGRFDFLTGNQMRDDSLLWNVKTSLGGLITQGGDVLNVGTFLRGYTAGVQLGKILPFWQANPNSGPTLMSSFGFMQYKINLFDRDNAFPQIRDEYKKGYDRLTNGLYLEPFVGYTYYDKKKFINFFAGFNFLLGFTQGRRDYLFDLQRPDTGARFDVLSGFKMGWVLPIYKKNVEDIYY